MSLIYKTYTLMQVKDGETRTHFLVVLVLWDLQFSV